MKKRLVALLLAAVFVTACSPSGSGTDGGGNSATEAPANAPSNPNAAPSNPNDTGDAASVADPGVPNEWGWVVPAQTLELSVWGGQGDPVAFAEDENGGGAVMDAWLLENLNVKLEWIINSNDRTEQLNLMLANGDYPDILTAVPDVMADTFATQGRAVELTPYLDNRLSNVSRRVGDVLGLLETADGKLYKLPNQWGETPDAVGADFGIRYDMFLETGLPMYTTPEEYYNVLKAILELHPTNDAGEKTYAVSVPWNDGLNLMRPMLWAYGFTPDFYKHNGDGSFTYWLNTEQGREAGLLINRMFREGMVDPDFLSRTYDDYVAMLATSRVIGNLGTWWVAFVGGHETWISEPGYDPVRDLNKRFMNAAVAGPGLDYSDTFLFTSNFLRTDRAIVSDKARIVEGALDFINWQNSELGNLIIGWGVPAADNFWNIDASGNWVIKDDVIHNMNVDKNAYFHTPREAHGSGRYMISLCRGTLKSDGRSNYDKLDPRVTLANIYDFWPWNPATNSYLDAGINISWGNYKAPAKDTLVYSVTFNPESSEQMAKATLDAELPTWWANIVTAPTAEACNAAFDAAAAAASVVGIAGLEKFYADQYAAKSALMD